MIVPRDWPKSLQIYLQCKLQYGQYTGYLIKKTPCHEPFIGVISYGTLQIGFPQINGCQFYEDSSRSKQAASNIKQNQQIRCATLSQACLIGKDKWIC